MRIVIYFMAFIFVAGCSTIPFKETEYVSMKTGEPLEAVERYKEETPYHFQLMNTVILGFLGKRVSCLGFFEVDTSENSYAVACLSPIGVKLFELTGGSEGVNSYFVPGEFKGREAFTSSIGEDIKRIYFDVVPPLSSDIERKKYELIFRHKLESSMIKYVFAGPNGHLVEKSYYEDNRLRWRVSYYEYERKDGKIYPGGIIYNNYSYGYTLTLTLKEVLN